MFSMCWSWSGSTLPLSSHQPWISYFSWLDKSPKLMSNEFYCHWLFLRSLKSPIASHRLQQLPTTVLWDPSSYRHHHIVSRDYRDLDKVLEIKSHFPHPNFLWQKCEDIQFGTAAISHATLFPSKVQQCIGKQLTSDLYPTKHSPSRIAVLEAIHMKWGDLLCASVLVKVHELIRQRSKL